MIDEVAQNPTASGGLRLMSEHSSLHFPLYFYVLAVNLNCLFVTLSHAKGLTGLTPRNVRGCGCIYCALTRVLLNVASVLRRHWTRTYASLNNNHNHYCHRLPVAFVGGGCSAE